ncbi:MAG: hypothetical protein R2862_10225 [Thermoanaerobaculia bacterium]
MAKPGARGGRSRQRAPTSGLSCGKSPYSVPFLSQLAYAEQRAGKFATARRTWELALAVNPANRVLPAHESGRARARRRGSRRRPNAPRGARCESAASAGLDRSRGRCSAAPAARPTRRALRDAVAAHCDSAILHTRLARIGLARGELAAAETDGRRATELLPDWSVAWQVWAEVAARAGDETAARERAARARALAGVTTPTLRGRAARSSGRPDVRRDPR